MAVRLCNIFLQQMRGVQRHFLLKSQILTSHRNDFAGCVQCLHVVTYDKDRKAASLRNHENEEETFDKIPRHNNNFSEIREEYKEHAAADSTEYAEQENEKYFKGGEPLAADEDELKDEKYTQNLPNRRYRLRLIDYIRLIKEHLSAKRLDEAIAVLQVRMLQKDRVKPDKYIYNLLISACAKAGQSGKAFSLFTKMRQRGLTATGGTYTSLFNACANCTNPTYALEQITQLRETMLEKNITPNIKHYNAMIKAYGRSGDLKTAFQLVDELLERQLPLNTSSFNFLLQACASDIEFGFRHSLLTWHKMLQLKLKPDYYSFKTMLRCVRDCGFGDIQHMQQVLEEILKQEDQLSLKSRSDLDETVTLKIESSQKARENTELTHETPNVVGKLLVKNNECEQLEVPNLLLPQPHLGSLVELSEINKPHERFLLLGSINGYLEVMKSCNVTPDIELFTAMLDVVPPTYAAEKQIISWIRRIGLKADIDFFNVLIKKRSMRFDYEGAKEVLSMIRTAGLHTDIVTYGVLALGCQTPEAARELLQEMHKNGVRLNIQILGAMLRQGCAQKNFPYIIEILQLALDENIPPNEMFLQHLHKFYNQCARSIDARHPGTKKQSYKKGHAKFCDKLRIYYTELGLNDLKLEDKIKMIQKQLRTKPAVEGKEELKNEELARKQKERKYIKKIKLQKFRDDADIQMEQLNAGADLKS